MGYSGKIPLKITKNEKGCLARTRHLFCTEDVKLLSKKGNYAMLKTEDYRLAVQSLSEKGVMHDVYYIF